MKLVRSNTNGIGLTVRQTLQKFRVKEKEKSETRLTASHHASILKEDQNTEKIRKNAFLQQLQVK